MELKRKYRENFTDSGNLEVKGNGWFRKNMSLTGLYYHLSRYGEDLARPTAALAIVILSTLFWLTQADPLIGPSFSRFVGLIYIVDLNHWGKSFERGIADFLPLLQLGSNAKVGLVDYIITIYGGVLIFSVIAISLRRRFRH